jgi:hypothetical protein
LRSRKLEDGIGEFDFSRYSIQVDGCWTWDAQGQQRGTDGKWLRDEVRSGEREVGSKKVR